MDKSEQISRLNQRLSDMEANLQTELRNKDIQLREHYRSASDASENAYRTQLGELDRQLSELRLQLQSSDQTLKRQLVEKENALAIANS